MARFIVGGFLRDKFLGIASKDVDFAVEILKDGKAFNDVQEAFDIMEAQLVEEGFKIFLSTPDKLTSRALVPEGHPLTGVTKVADFVLCRMDGPYTDGRRPDWVKPSDIWDDLARRDFTVNAIAQTEEGEILDPHNGRADIETMTLRFMGDAEQRIREDGLRVIRAFRFMSTKGFTMVPDQLELLTSEFASDMIRCVSVERIRPELETMFHFDTIKAMKIFQTLPDHTLDAIFRKPLRLAATQKVKKLNED